MVNSMKKVWDHSPIEKRKQLLNTLGYKTVWANISYDQLSKRSGGMIKRDLDRLWEERKRRRKH